MNLDDVVPVPDHVTHQARVIDAPRRAVWDELHQLKLRSMPVSLVLSALRAMPVLLTGKRHNGGVDATFLDVVPIPLLSSEPPTAVVFGGVLQAWRLTRCWCWSTASAATPAPTSPARAWSTDAAQRRSI